MTTSFSEKRLQTLKDYKWLNSDLSALYILVTNKLKRLS